MNVDEMFDKGLALYNEGRKKEAFDIFLELAEAGNQYAQYNVAQYYRVEEGFINPNKAFEWCQKSALQGNPQAMGMLAVLYQDGVGTQTDEFAKWYWLKKAAEAGHIDALKMLYDMKRKEDMYEAAYWLKLGINTGDEEFIYIANNGFDGNYDEINYVAACYEISQEDKRSAGIAHLQELAEHGNSSALRQLANMYVEGTILPQNYAKAFELYQKAVAVNPQDELAVYNLACSYMNGFGTMKNPAMARQYMERAAELGHAAAVNEMINSYTNGSNPTELVRWVKKGLECDLMAAQGMYGVMCRDGYAGVPKNLNEAKMWLEKSIAQGHTVMQPELDKLNAMLGNTGTNTNTNSTSKKKKGGGFFKIVFLGIVAAVVYFMFFK